MTGSFSLFISEKKKLSLSLKESKRDLPTEVAFFFLLFKKNIL